MGMDLTLYPLGAEKKSVGWGLSRDYQLFAKIDNTVMCEEQVKQACKPKPLPEQVKFRILETHLPFGVFKPGPDDCRAGIVTKDPYGEPLTYSTAGELAKLDCNGFSEWNKDVLRRIKRLKPETKVVLFWH